jgi:hypothetical protein
MTLRDGPRAAANANATLKWMSLPPRRRFDLLAVANVLRSSRGWTVLSRHTTNSSHRTRGQLPQVIEVLLRTVGMEPKLAPSVVPERVLRRAVELEPRFGPSVALERVVRVPNPSRERGSWAGPSKDLVPRRGLPHPLRSAFAVFHDLGGLLLSEPSDVFQPVTLVEFPVRKSST